MSKISNKFVTLGLRADKNLSDVLNAESALNGILNDLVSDPDPNKTFSSQDLDAIRGLQNSNIIPSKLSVLSDITVAASNPEDSLLPIIVDPLVRIIDRIQNIKIATGEIPAIQGGDGLMATFIPSTNVNVGTSTSTGDTIFTIPQNPVKEVFWESGYFNFPSFLDSTFNNQYGGIQWVGYFTPTLRDPSINITISSTGLVMFEIDREDNGNWEPLLNIYAAERTVSFTAVEAENTIFTIGLENSKFVSEGDYVKDTEITVLDLTDGKITLSGPVFPEGTELTFKKIQGETVTSNIVTLPAIEVGSHLKIRLSYWFVDDNEDVREKYLELMYIGSNLNYSSLYSVKPSDVLQPTEIRKVLRDVVSPFQNNFGQPLNNKKFYVSDSTLLVYNPTMKSLANIRKAGPNTLTFTLNSNVVSGSVLQNTEIGNIIVPASPSSAINTIIAVRDNISNQVKVVTNNPGLSGDISVNIIEHRGFIGWYRATSSGTTVTLVSGTTADIATGFIVITNTSSTYIRVTQVNSSTTFTTSANLSLSGTEIIYIYSDRSLVDRSKEVFCRDVFGQVVASTAVAGATTLTLESTTGVIAGLYVQFDGIIDVNTQVVGTPTGNTITLSKPLLATLDASNTVVFVPQSAGGTLNREGCVIPLNTAPPFIGISTGLSTNNKNIKSGAEYSSFTVEVETLTAVINSSNITKPATGDSTFNKKVLIKAKLGNQLRNFSILSIKKV